MMPGCSPSRSAVITGSYAIRLGTHVQRSNRFPGEEIYLPDGYKTVPEVFRDATACTTDGMVILLAAGTKKRQARDIDRAIVNWRAYRQEKRNADQNA